MDSNRKAPSSPLSYFLHPSLRVWPTIATDAEILTSTEQPENLAKRRKLEVPSNILTVAISGCSASGKTTLALLLYEIFSPISTHSSPTKLCASGQETDSALQRVAASSAKIIHQDAFFIPKAFCPFVSFYSTANDTPFIKKSMMGIDMNPTYYYSWSGMETNGEVCITGPNTDCQEAIDFGGLLREVQQVKHSIMEPGLEPVFRDEDADRQKLVEEYAGLIQNMRDRVKNTTNQIAETNGKLQSNTKFSDGQPDTRAAPFGWLFVEGFMLFSKDISSEDADVYQDINNDEEAYADVADEIKPAVKKEVARLTKELKRMSQERVAAMDALVQTFDIKLFLPTSKEVAKERRMTRAPYVDEPIGRRQPGQMWKSEGYFEDVVWSGYEKQYDWLLREAGKDRVDGVFVRPSLDANVEDTVRWAVDVILDVLVANGQK